MMFFRDVLLLDETLAERDACSIEHHLSLEALERMSDFYQFITSCPEADKQLIGKFKACCMSDQGSRAGGCQAGVGKRCKLDDPAKHNPSLEIGPENGCQKEIELRG